MKGRQIKQRAFWSYKINSLHDPKFQLSLQTHTKIICGSASSIGHFEWFSKGNIALNRRGQHLTTQSLALREIKTQNITDK